MKEATGELNMTVITVVAIAAIAAIFYAFVWPALKKNIDKSTQCASAVCPSCGSKTEGALVTCTKPGGGTIDCPCQKNS